MRRKNPYPWQTPPKNCSNSMDPNLGELNHILDLWLRRYRLRRAVTWMVRGLAAGLAAGLALTWLLAWREVILRQEYFQFLLLFSLAGFIVGALVAYAWPVARLSAARYFDRQLGLKERVSTALELAANQEENPGSSSDIDHLRNQQLQDARQAASKANLRARLPILIPKWAAALVLILVIAVIASLPLAAARFEAARQQRAVQAAIETAAAQLDALIEKIQADPQLKTSQKEILAQPLQTAAQTLHETNTLENSVSALTQAQGELQALADPQAESLAQGLRQAGQEMSRAVGSPLEQTAQQLARGELKQAARSIAGIDPTRMRPAQQAELSHQLEEFSNMVQKTESALSQQLGEAARQLQAGRTTEARQVMQQAAESLAAAGEELAQANRASEAAAHVEAGRQELLQGAGLPDLQFAEGSSQAGRPGASEGAGTSSQSGTGSGAVGAGRGNGQGETENGPEAGVSPIEQSNGLGDGGLQPPDQVFAPRRLGGTGGPVVTLPEGGQPGETTSRSGTLPLGQIGQSQVPYTEVYQAYAQAYRQAIEHGQVPPALRDVVRDYFSSLEP